MTQDANQYKTAKCVMQVFENHAQDSRITDVSRGGCPTLGSSNGDCLSGKNVIVVHKEETT